MNNSYYETLDENFAQALNLYEKEFTHEELIQLLKNGNIVQKQIAALRIENISSVEDANVLVENLTGQDGKIREVISLRLNEFMSDDKTIKYFQNIKTYDKFLDAITDINANICRNVISAISNLKNEPEFCQHFCQKLIKLSSELLDKIETFDFQDGKYKINKEVFKLYWCLETIYEFYDKIELEKLKQVILRSKDIQEYTIREKAAKILTYPIIDSELIQAKKELQNDKNYYVRRFK